MRAAITTRFGPPDVVEIRDAPTPAPKAGEVLVQVYATTVCAADRRLRAADPAFIRIMGLTKILGIEFAGRVAGVGAGVTKFKPGDAVFGAAGFQMGAHAEYVCVPEKGWLDLKPANMSFEEAAAVLFGGVSALHYVRGAKVSAGQRVLVYGASGSVGVFAVQLAKHFGAHVTGVCSGANVEMVHGLGADAVVDYTREDFSDAGPVYDVIIDTVGYSGLSRSLRALKRGGVFAQVALTGFGEMMGWWWASVTGRAKLSGGLATGKSGDAAFLKELIEAGQLRTVIDRRYRLEEIVDAHAYVDTGRKKGHVVIVVAAPNEEVGS